MRVAAIGIVLSLAVSACSSAGGGPYPSLAPRAGEAIDPRVPVPEVVNDRPASAALTGRLAELISQARQGDAQFGPAVDRAEALASAAGAAQTESWIAAQEALSAADAARAPTTRALGDIDALGATSLQVQGGLAPNDLAAIRSAGAEVGRMAERQSRRLQVIHERLGL
jgi:hypothetical protein